MTACCDVLIAGGGMVGASLALALDTLGEGRLRITLVEGTALPATPPTAIHPGFDARSTALAEGSRLIFERLGLWAALAPTTAPISRIHVSERGRPGSAELAAGDRGWPALGYVVENARLGRTLLTALHQRPGISLMQPARVVACHPGAEAATVTIARDGEQHALTAALVVIADGADSTLRQRLGIHTDVKTYQRQAIVANVGCSSPHGGRAYERFTDWGPMALLPLPDGDEARPRMALVWTMPPARADELLGASDGLFLGTLQQRFGHCQGQLLRVGQRHAYDLRLVRATEQIRRQLVLVGNAAHSLHPVAGQGFNLALRDLSRLAEVIARAAARGEPIGDLPVLARYTQCQASDQWRTTLFSDRVGALFENGFAPLSHLRRLGLVALDLNPALKNLFVDHTAGFHAGAAVGVAP